MFLNETEYTCIYCGEHWLQVFTEETTNDEMYKVFVHHEQENADLIHITLMNLNDEKHTYISIMTPQLYSTIKKEQELCVSFQEFVIQLVNMFHKAKENEGKLHLNLVNGSQLRIIHRMEIKNLLVLSLGIRPITADELMSYYKISHKKYSEELNHLKETISNKSDKLKNFMIESSKTKQKISEEYKLTESKCVHNTDVINATTKMQHILQNCEKAKTKNDAKRKNLQELILEMVNEKKNLEELQKKCTSDMESYKHVHQETISLKCELDETQSTSIPKEKYDKLVNMVSTTIADLLATQAELEKAVSKIEEQKELQAELKAQMKSGILDLLEMEAECQENVFDC